MEEEYKESELSKIVKKLMDEEGYEFGEAVKEAIKKGYAYGGGVGHLLEPTQTYHQYHDFTAPMTVGAMVDNMYNRGGRVNYESGGWNPGVGRDKKGYQKTSPHHSSRDDGPPSITNPYVPPVVKKPPVQVSDSDINPMFQHLITPAAAVKTDFLKKHGWYNNPFTFKGSPLMKAGAEAGGYGLDYDKLIGGDLTVGEVLEGMSGGTYDTFDPNVQKTLGEQILGNVDFGDTFQKNWSTDVVEPTIKDGKIDIDETKLEVDEMPVKPKDVLEIGVKDGGRVGMFMGGDPLTGQALSIYESMNSYGFSDAEIASALQQQGLYTPPGSGTPTPDPDPTPPPTSGQGGGGDSNDPYPGQIVDQTDYSFNKKNYGPGGKLEVNPAALGISFEKASPPQGIINQALQTPGRTLTSFASPTTGGNITGPAEEGFMSQVVDIDPAGRTREQLRQQYDDYNRFLGRRSNYANARVPGKAGQVIGTIGGAIAGIPGLGFLGGIGSNKDKSLQSKYGVEGGFGGGNTKFRDEFGLSVVDDSKRLFGKRDRDYVTRMNERLGELDKFFSDRIEGFDINNLTPDMLTDMRRINGFYTKQVQAYKDRLNVENLNRKYKKEEEAAALQARIDAERAAGAAANQMTQRREGKGGDHMSRSRDQGGLGISAAQAQAVSDANREAGMGGWGLKDGGVASMFTRRR